MTEDENFNKIKEEIQQEYNDNAEDEITMEKSEENLEHKQLETLM